MKKTIELTVANKELAFQPTQELYGEYLGAMARGDFTESAHNFVMQSAIDDETKQTLRELDEENAAAMIQIAGVIVGVFAPKLAISVKK